MRITTEFQRLDPYHGACTINCNLSQEPFLLTYTMNVTAAVSRLYVRCIRDHEKLCKPMFIGLQRKSARIRRPDIISDDPLVEFPPGLSAQ